LEKRRKSHARRLVSKEDLKRRLLKLLRRKYGRISWQEMHGDKTQIKLKQIDYGIQLIRDVCKRRSMDIEGL
jgi:hypothetical protein